MSCFHFSFALYIIYYVTHVVYCTTGSIACSKECTCSVGRLQYLGEEQQLIVNCTGVPSSTTGISSADIFIYNGAGRLDNKLISSLHNLKHLVIGGGIESLNSVTPVPSLESLHVSHAPLLYIPELALQKISTALLLVSLTQCGIEYLNEESFVQLDSLQYLNLSRNHIGSLRDGLLNGLSVLRTLDLSFNKLQDLTQSNLIGLKSLNWLSVEGNQLSSLDNIELPFNGVEFFVQKNPLLKVLWNSPKNMELALLDISSSSLVAFERGSFSNCKVDKMVASNLTRLQLIDFHAFSNLRTEEIQITDNRNLRYIDPQAIYNVTNLSRLNISNNHLYAIPPFLSSSKLSVVTAFGNNLLCNCNFLRLKNLKKPRIEVSSDWNLSPCENLNGNNQSSKIQSGQEHCAPRVIFKTDSNLTVDEGDQVTHRCKAVGWPEPTVSWEYGSRVIPAMANVAVVNNDIVIDGARPLNSGIYRCVAKNRVGSAYANFKLTVVADDAQIIISGVGKNYVEFSWKTPNRRRQYKAILINVKTSTQTSYNLEDIPISRHSPSFTISGLQSSMTYRVCIAFTNRQFVDMNKCQTITTSSLRGPRKKGITAYNVQGIVIATISCIVTFCFIICVCVASRIYSARKKRKELYGMVSESSYGLMTTSFSLRSNLSSLYDNPGAFNSLRRYKCKCKYSPKYHRPESQSSSIELKLKRSASDPLVVTDCKF